MLIIEISHPGLGHAKPSPKGVSGCSVTLNDIRKLYRCFDGHSFSARYERTHLRQIEVARFVRRGRYLAADLGQQEVWAKGVRDPIAVAPLKQATRFSYDCSGCDVILAANLFS